MAKKQLAKAALDRIKRSAKETPGFKKKPKPKVKVTSIKTGIKKAKKAVNFDKFKQPAPKAKRLVASPTKEAIKDTARIGAAGAAGFAVGKIDSAKKTKKMASEAYKKQEEKQKKYREKKGK